ncbi:cobyrinate a,c-diamide synthase [Deinococcus maricopensis]|uniref:Cobyrinate a,c-diamide synthase n=1 Tax=Deinococcus maricopensis (strain DSM 21211 / LMG 22137 / NRRL B-23946 / LB-34) TaxID=709986 RepID=E8U9J6_DEIML|nr:cobyrinate a,c-diamide synthase [Deinococcus maricopensis]ADV67735.1 Cobyrinic acid A,C-diamide synthase [Deinococcus maricopensis DSM 21211]
MSPHRFLIAAPHSGSGKTTVTSAILAGLRARGLRVQPFKAGPDYLDPTHLSRAAGQAARNLDSFLLPEETLRTLFARASADADVSVIEGVMGLFDGRDPTSDLHSSAHLARTLDCPVVLVIDAGGMARTVAAVAAGLRDFAPDLHVAGVILNRVGSERHAQLCEAALAQVGLPVLGFVPRTPALGLPARHLGLLAAETHPHDEAALLGAAATLHLDALLAATTRAPLPTPARTARADARVRVALARDEAFSFYYWDALDALEQAGADLVPFSPLRDERVPDADALLIGGGYPEAHAAALAANAGMRASVQAFAASGRPVVAECGGLMYLSEHLEDERGDVHAMCGVVPYRTRMTGRLTLGYRDARALADTPLAPAGAPVRAHEFHYSALTHAPTHPAYDVNGTPEGYARGNVLASYLHLHLAADPAFVERFLTEAERAR